MTVTQHLISVDNDKKHLIVFYFSTESIMKRDKDLYKTAIENKIGLNVRYTTDFDPSVREDYERFIGSLMRLTN